jgi:HD-like signal output (HDOD) protein
MAEVLRVAHNENASADELAQVLLKDATLTAGVLKIVNSPFYAHDSRIGSVHQAVMTIGVRQVVTLALSCSVYRMTNDWESSLDRVRFWRHSLEVALAAKAIAVACGHPDTEETFVAGLLHDFGLLVLERAFPKQFADVWEKGNQAGEVIEIEQARWGTNHAAVGRFLFEHWRLPESICRAVGDHHTFPTGGTGCSSRLPAILYLAGRISKFNIAWEQTINPIGMHQKASVRDLLGIAPDTLRTLERDLLTAVVEQAAFLDMEIGTPQEIMMEANRILFDQYVTVENLLKELQSLNQPVSAENLERTLWERAR